MSQRKDLLKVSYHSDDDSGTYRIGEIDFGINGGLRDYLKSYGRSGCDDIIKTLSYLIYSVESEFRSIDEIENPAFLTKSAP